jgi:ribulose-bisphosphate carboxylase large chain
MPNKNQRAEFRARYWVESPYPLQKVADVIAGEQSSGTFLRLPGESDELKRRSRARVVRIDPLQPAHEPSLLSAYVARRGDVEVYHRGEVEIAFPIDNVGHSLSTLMATVAGNLYELGEVTGLRLLDLDLPDDFVSGFSGPQFGVEGTRAMTQVHDRPLIGTIIKPSIGLTPSQTAELVDSLCSAGIDFIKDDELIANPPYAPFSERLSAVMPVLRRHADRLGRMPMYAINISGSVEEMRQRHDEVVRAGGTCVMVSVNWVGLSAVEDLRRYAQVPIHGHRNGWGALTRCPQLGMDFAAYQKVWRLAGVDQLHVNGLRSKFWEPDASVIASAKACMVPLGGHSPIVPVFSSGQWGAQAPDMYGLLKSVDLMHLAGGGIIGHPDGIAAGVASMREAWEAAVAGVDLTAYAESRPALKGALAQFSGR